MSLLQGEFGYHELERAALGFVLETETWPVFLAWARANTNTDAARKWLEQPDLMEARILWVAHSPADTIAGVCNDS